MICQRVRGYRARHSAREFHDWLYVYLTLVSARPGGKHPTWHQPNAPLARHSVSNVVWIVGQKWSQDQTVDFALEEGRDRLSAGTANPFLLPLDRPPHPN